MVWRRLELKVLVVDDEAHIVELARLDLSREGYEVEGIGDGTRRWRILPS